jgi:phosphonate transport system substrate-binding protein
MTSILGRLWPMAIVGALAAHFGLALAAEPEYSPEFTDAPSTSQVTEYIFGVHPLHNPERLFAVYGPIMDYLSAHIPGTRFRLEASRNYAEFDKKLDEGRFHFALPNPYQTLRSLDHGYEVFGKMGDDQNFRGIILVRKDSGIENVSDLKGRAVSYPAATALAATMMPQYFLHTHGLDVNKDIRNVYVGSQESSIMNVFHGFVAAGATWPTPWIAFQEQHPDMAGLLEVKWQTDTLPNNGLVVRKDVPKDVMSKAANLLLTLHESEEGRKLLAPIPLSRFEAASDVTYAPVREFLSRFAAEVRPPEGG